MRAITKILTAAAAAASIAAFAAPSQAASLLTFATAGGTTTGSVLSFSNATNTLSASNISTNFNFVLPEALSGVAAKLSFTGSAGAGTATCLLGVCIQDGLSGSFDFTASQAFTYQSVNYGIGTSILHADFTNGKIVVGQGTGSVLDSNLVAGQIVNYTSGIAGFADYELNGFAFSLTPRGTISQNVNGKINDFKSGVSGTFSGAVPEPGTWALMIVGFGAAGAMMRRRKYAVAL